MDAKPDQTPQAVPSADTVAKSQATLRLVRPRTRNGTAADRHPVPPGAGDADHAPAPLPAAEWLATTCRLAPGIESAAVFDAAHPVAPVRLAAWPTAESFPASRITGVLDAARKGRCIVITTSADAAAGERKHVIALPLTAAGHPRKVAVVRMPAASDAQCRRIAQHINQCAAWLPRLAPVAQGSGAERSLLEAIAQCIGADSLRSAAMAISTQLATQLGCERVSIALLHQGRLRLAAISRHGNFDERAALPRSISSAMEEALAHDATVAHPAVDGGGARAAHAHAALCQEAGIGFACTIPFASAGEFVGAATFEHESAARFDAGTLAFCESVMAFVGPILAAYRRAERSPAMALREQTRAFAAGVLGPRRVALKGLLAVALTVLMAGARGHGEHRVKAQAVLRGTVQRLAVAPIDGFVAEAPARAGDVVEAGQLLALLDERALQLEQVKWSSERDRLLNEYRTAMADLDSTKVTLLRSQLDRATAELTLAQEQLARTRIVAPFAGVLVSGDLTQSIGAPVKKGDTLFEIAPLDSYRVMLEIDERDIGHVAAGQQGRIVLAGFPGEPLEFLVERITPVSRVSDGRNFFSVEARLLQTPPLLRPGMQGVAKLGVGERRLGWLWTHRVTEWVSLQLWRWFGIG